MNKRISKLIILSVTSLFAFSELGASRFESKCKSVNANSAAYYMSPVYNTPGDPKTGLKCMESKYNNNCIEVDSWTKSFENDCWYIVRGTCNYSYNSITVNGSANLILADDCRFTIKNIEVNEGSELTIYSQSNNSGFVRLETDDDTTGAGIGCTEGHSCGKITINGGTYEAKIGDKAAIGGGIKCEGSNIVINNSTVYGGDNDSCGALIGGAYGKSGHDIVINSCNISKTEGNAGIGSGSSGSFVSGAEGYNIYINDSTVDIDTDRTAAIGAGYGHDGHDIYIKGCNIKQAYGGNASAGIGGGEDGSGYNIHIIDSTVKAKGSYTGGAGIGGGLGGGAENILIKDCSKVEAYGGSDGGAGIGGGEYSRGGAYANYITIDNSYVEAHGYDGGSGIGGGEGGSASHINIINGSTVFAYGGSGDGGAGIGGGEDGVGEFITISDSTVTAYGGESDGGAGIGGGECGEGRDITITNSTVKAWGGDDSAGIGAGHGRTGCRITITDSTIEAYGRGAGAGIGGGEDGWGTNITIQGDKSNVYASSSDYGTGAGIGGGEDGGATDINILGGVVKAYGGNASFDDKKGGAGIGGGKGNIVWNVHIENADVTAYGSCWASGIGNGSYSTNGDSYNITVSREYVVKADWNRSGPTTVITNNGNDLAKSISGRRFVIIKRTVFTTGSVFSNTSIWIIIGCFVILLGGTLAVLLLKKKPQNN